MNPTNKKSLKKDNFENKKVAGNSHFLDLFMYANCPIAIMKGKEHVFQMTNTAFLNMVGKKNILGKKAGISIPELESQGFIEIMDNVFLSGLEYTMTDSQFQFKNRNGSGSLKDYYLNFIFQPCRDKAGNIDGVCFMGIDVTGQTDLRKRFLLLEKQFQLVAETAQEGIWILDKENRIRFVNSKLCALMGYTKEEMIGKQPSFFSKYKKTPLNEPGFVNHNQASPNSHDHRFVTRSGETVWVELITNPIFDKQGMYEGVVVLITDLTQRKKLEKKAAVQKARWKKQVRKAAILAQEKERNFLGSELHDNINQILLAIKLYLKHYLQNADASIEAIQTSYDQLTRAIEEIRKISFNLVTHRFSELSFASEVMSLINSLPIGEIIRTDLSHLQEALINENIKLAIFRIIQEHLSNVIKYANATEVQIQLSNDRKKLSLLISDDGVGFNPKERAKGAGITNIFNRVEILNGSVNLESETGKGCLLSVSIPLRQNFSIYNLNALQSA